MNLRAFAEHRPGPWLDSPGVFTVEPSHRFHLVAPGRMNKSHLNDENESLLSQHCFLNFHVESGRMC